LYDRYEKLGSLAEQEVFNFLYREAVKLTASLYGFTPIIHEEYLESAFNRFIKLFIPLTNNEYSDDKTVTLTVAVCIQATAAFPIVWNGGQNVDGNIQSQLDAFATTHPRELVALSFGVLIFSVESSRILRASGLHSSNYVELEFLDVATIRNSVQIIRKTRATKQGKVDYTQQFRHLIRLLKKVLDYKISNGRISKR
jgi:hypothetical protein